MTAFFAFGVRASIPKRRVEFPCTCRIASSKPTNAQRATLTCTANAEPNSKVTVTFRGRRIDARPGEKIRDVLMRTDARTLTPHNGGAQIINCRGLGTCGTCAVMVEQGEVSPRNRSTRENIRLSFPPHSMERAEEKNLRLACQVRVIEDIEIRKNNGFWGQGDGEQPYEDELETK